MMKKKFQTKLIHTHIIYCKTRGKTMCPIFFSNKILTVDLICLSSFVERNNSVGKVNKINSMPKMATSCKKSSKKYVNSIFSPFNQSINNHASSYNFQPKFECKTPNSAVYSKGYQSLIYIGYFKQNWGFYIQILAGNCMKKHDY